MNELVTFLAWSALAIGTVVMLMGSADSLPGTATISGAIFAGSALISLALRYPK